MIRPFLQLAFLILSASAVVAEDGSAAQSVIVRDFADSTASSPSPSGASKVLFFERDSAGELVVVGLALIAEKSGQISAPARTLAIMRSRTGNSEKKQRPDSEDRRFASDKQVSVYVVGEWSKPATLWEIDPTAKPMRFRKIDQTGAAGVWAPLGD